MRLAPTARAIVYGVLVDIGGSILAGLVLATLYAFVLAGSGMAREEILQAISDPQPASWYSIAGFVVGCAASFLGGYVCARLAAPREMRAVSAVAAVSGVVSLAMGPDAYAFEWTAVLALAGMGAVFAGGWAGMQGNRRRAA